MGQFFLLFSVTVFSGTSPGYADSKCAEKIILALRGNKNSQNLAGGLQTFLFNKDIKIPVQDRAFLSQLALHHGVKSVPETYFEFINSVYLKIKSSKSSALKKGQKMSYFAHSLRPSLAKLGDQDSRSVQFTLANAVLTLEAFPLSDFQKIESFALTKPGTVATIEDFDKWTTEYVTKTGKYLELLKKDHQKHIDFADTWHPVTLSRRGATGELEESKIPATYEAKPVAGEGLEIPLTGTDIREMQVHNQFPIYLRPHDARHVHHMTGHPYAAYALFASARSQNNLRYAIVSGLAEGIDTVQYPQEIALLRYFNRVMKMDTEQAMLYLATAPDAEIVRIDKAIEKETEELIKIWIYGGTFRNVAAGFRNWKPKTQGKWNGENIDTQLNNAVGALIENKKKASPEKRKILNFDRLPEKQGVETDRGAIVTE